MDSVNRKVEAIHIAPRIVCTNCKEQIEIPINAISAYVNGEEIPCPLCLNIIDFWQAMLNLIRMNSSWGHSLVPIGAQLTLFHLEMEPNDVIDIKFSEYGIPKDVVILGVNITPQGSNLIVTTEWPNYYIKNSSMTHLRLYGQQRDNLSPHPTKVAIIVTWIYHSFDDESWKYIMDAFGQYQSNNYLSSIIPANIAFESILSRFLTSVFEKFATKDRVESFLSNGATYSHQLNVLLPSLAKITTTRVLPEHISGHLNRLRKLRNDLVHSGKLESIPTEEEVAQFLCSVLFGFHYIKTCGPKILYSV